ncbi:uncharacterized protein CLUP02_13302 [Colletotrichum lupini]|uniref:Uncharacterized protein n=1 Tax=Colletotrichum lupini TaxID=145971 RepID=A0A9Q8T2N0_9PEZI|nr:uncharacterized protein CLUP02_13302 [Colletotrichum lupini]UQC87783.1 hypothetical protein CLUP02_13302 [Colletotrichum lupini]
MKSELTAHRSLAHPTSDLWCFFFPVSRPTPKDARELTIFE